MTLALATAEVVELATGVNIDDDPVIDDWATRVRSHMSRAAEEILATGQALIDCKAAVDHGQFTAVCVAVGMGARTAQRLMSIASNPALATHVSHLPPSWSTLYELSRIPDFLLESAIDEGRVHPGMERRDAVWLRQDGEDQTAAIRRAAAPELDADAELTKRAHKLADLYVDGVRPKGVMWTEKPMRSRSADCNIASGRIRINCAVRHAPDYVIDFLLVHELAHLIHGDHSPAFREVEHRFPQHEAADAWLSGASSKDFISWLCSEDDEPETEPQPKPERSEWHRGKRHIDPHRVLTTVVMQLDAITNTEPLDDGELEVAIKALDPAERQEMVASLDESLTRLVRFANQVRGALP